MSISWFGGVFGLGNDEMAKASKTKAHEERVSVYVARLTAAKTRPPCV